LMFAVLNGLLPLVKWALAIIAGSGAAGIVQTGSTAVRAASTTTTGGIANPVVSTVEAGLSFGLSLLAVFIPVVAASLAMILLFWLGNKIIKKLKRKSSNLV